MKYFYNLERKRWSTIMFYVYEIKLSVCVVALSAGTNIVIVCHFSFMTKSTPGHPLRSGILLVMECREPKRWGSCCWRWEHSHKPLSSSCNFECQLRDYLSHTCFFLYLDTISTRPFSSTWLYNASQGTSKCQLSNKSLSLPITLLKMSSNVWHNGMDTHCGTHGVLTQ